MSEETKNSGLACATPPMPVLRLALKGEYFHAIRRGENAHTNYPLFAKIRRIARVAHILIQPTIEFTPPIICILGAAQLHIGHAKRCIGYGS